MNRFSSPIRVSPPPPVVPRLSVTNSRMSFRAPMTSVVFSPAYLRSWGGPPTDAMGAMRVSGPISVGPWTTVWGPSRQPSPRRTSGPITQCGPMETPLPISADGSMTARGSIPASVATAQASLSTRAERISASATFLPSTSAMPRILQFRERSLSTSTVKRSWSPGITA